MSVQGYREVTSLADRTVMVHDQMGHLYVEHDGDLGWDELFDIKNLVWGDTARAIEVYPAKANLVNTGNYRHLWRLGPNDFCPDMLGDCDLDGLQARQAVAWSEAA